MAGACRLKASGQCGSPGSGSSRASSTARDEASGRRAHQRWSVDGCPWRIDFSRAACRDTSAIGKSTSASRRHARGITTLRSPLPVFVVPQLGMIRRVPATAVHAFLSDPNGLQVAWKFGPEVLSVVPARGAVDQCDTSCQSTALPGVDAVALVERDIHVGAVRATVRLSWMPRLRAVYFLDARDSSTGYRPAEWPSEGSRPSEVDLDLRVSNGDHPPVAPMHKNVEIAVGTGRNIDPVSGRKQLLEWKPPSALSLPSAPV